MQENKLCSAGESGGGKQFDPNLVPSIEGNYFFIIEGSCSREEALQQGAGVGCQLASSGKSGSACLREDKPFFQNGNGIQIPISQNVGSLDLTWGLWTVCCFHKDPLLVREMYKEIAGFPGGQQQELKVVLVVS